MEDTKRGLSVTSLISCFEVALFVTQHDKIDAKVQIGGGDLLATKRQHKKEELYAKEREERFAKLSAWKVSKFRLKLMFIHQR